MTEVNSAAIGFFDEEDGAQVGNFDYTEEELVRVLEPSFQEFSYGLLDALIEKVIKKDPSVLSIRWNGVEVARVNGNFSLDNSLPLIEKTENEAKSSFSQKKLGTLTVHYDDSPTPEYIMTVSKFTT